jgi:hypothetical protein
MSPQGESRDIVHDAAPGFVLLIPGYAPKLLIPDYARRIGSGANLPPSGAVDGTPHQRSSTVA